ncbi:LLM class flavin-dependent oxidoreductase [Xanthobacter sediminis]|uniref:LLM class flavin-dependent oxidoreductase n=1 Tax=Xanthobacter sediminis TaxID=3119926 RepID=UPI00372AAE83
MSANPVFAIAFEGYSGTSIETLLSASEAAEARGWTMTIIGGPGCPYDPITALAAIAARTTRIGLAAVVDVDRTPPYDFARCLASLDHVSSARAAWKPTTRAQGAEAAARMNEFITVVSDLWDSWDDDAQLYDKARGLYVDLGKVHRLDHAGAAFRVAGPLDIPRPPQGRPVLVREMAESVDPDLSVADVVLLPSDTGTASKGAPAPDRPIRIAGAPSGQSETLSHRWSETGVPDGFLRRAEATPAGVALASEGLPLSQSSIARDSPRAALGLRRPSGRFASVASERRV